MIATKALNYPQASIASYCKDGGNFEASIVININKLSTKLLRDYSQPGKELIPDILFPNLHSK
jgi:hypothetical protein